MANKLCINCKNCDAVESTSLTQSSFECKAKENIVKIIKNVDGFDFIKYRFILCTDQRRFGWVLSRLFRVCGEEGRWFEER